MDDRPRKARIEGDVPRAPGYLGWWVSLGGVAGAGLGAAIVPWRRLAAAGFGLEAHTPSLLAAALAPPALGCAAGAVLGLALGGLTLDRFTPRARWTVRGAPARGIGLGPLLVIVATLAVLPWLLSTPGGADPGRLLLGAPAAALGLAALLGLPLALFARARGRQVWRERVAPDPPPRRDEDALPPEVRQAIRDAGHPD